MHFTKPNNEQITQKQAILSKQYNKWQTCPKKPLHNNRPQFPTPPSPFFFHFLFFFFPFLFLSYSEAVEGPFAHTRARERLQGRPLLKCRPDVCHEVAIPSDAQYARHGASGFPFAVDAICHWATRWRITAWPETSSCTQ